MAPRTLRIYKVINASEILGPGAVFRFPSAEPVGSVTTVTIGGRTLRVLLHDHVVHTTPPGRLHAAEFVDV
ncbi:hypothetical protein ABT033_31305 [Streptomyces pharetrae]|uniref:hypothetical protein n=1 Tax=Streptomyces pharetrae TaxID=291370 RepID=UPI003356CF63